MRNIVLVLVVQVALLKTCTGQDAKTCYNDDDCPIKSYSCIDGICVNCLVGGMVCDPTVTLAPSLQCCKGTTNPMNCLTDLRTPNQTVCLPSKQGCLINADCPGILKCDITAGYRGVCTSCIKNGYPCGTVGPQVCCSQYCVPTPSPIKDYGLCGNYDTPTSCLTRDDCQSNFECRNNACMQCFRPGMDCVSDEDCCSGHCRSNRSHAWLTTAQRKRKTCADYNYEY
jgi:hypothetical protein